MKSSDQGEVQLQLSVTVAQYHENSITITITLYHKNSITVLKKSVAVSQLHISLQLILYSVLCGPMFTITISNYDYCNVFYSNIIQSKISYTYTVITTELSPGQYQGQ